MNLWFVTVVLDSICEECPCSSGAEALEFADALRSDYQGRISYLSITSPDETVELVIAPGVGNKPKFHPFSQTALSSRRLRASQLAFGAGPSLLNHASRRRIVDAQNAAMSASVTSDRQGSCRTSNFSHLLPYWNI